MAHIHPQLPLSLGLKESTLFANFLSADNAEAVAYLTGPAAAQAPCVYLWGPPGCGKTHLLQAVCHATGQRGEAAFYLPLRSADRFPLEALSGLETMAAVCIDDLDAVADQTHWQQALLALFERVKPSDHLLVLTGAQAPAELGVDPALSSRLAWGLSVALKPLTDRQKRAALQLRAERRGLRLADDAAKLLVKRTGGDMAVLFDAFERLDKASLAAKRRLTLGFIRQVLGWGEHG